MLKRKRDYFVSYAHQQGFGSFLIKDVIVRKPEVLHTEFVKFISEKESLSKVVILGCIKL